MSIGNEYRMSCDWWKLPGGMINHHMFFAAMFFLFENVPGKSRTSIFYFRCCCEDVDDVNHHPT
jgi:hypothetical protein